MFVHRSNRTEALVEELTRVVSRPLASPFTPECIVVQNRGLMRWLAMELSRRMGVLANAEFSYPGQIVRRAISAALGEAKETEDGFKPETLVWSIAVMLPDLARRDEFAPIRGYLQKDGRLIRLVQLSQRIAKTFDRYLDDRPEMLLDWEKGKGSDWQAALWRELVKKHGSTHLAARAQKLFDPTGGTQLAAKPPASLPERICMFGVSSLPRLYVQIFSALSRIIEVHLFVLSPSREYWADVRSKREIIRAWLAEGADAAKDDSALHLAEGHPLLASLGRMSRDFQFLLEDAGDYQESDRDLYHDPGTGNMLAVLQSDILSVRQRGYGPDQARPLAISPDDRSIAIHSCHGPMREVEVLRDQLLDLFREHPNLAPHEILVITRDIELYAPYIEAVFGSSSDDKPEIPFTIARRGVRAANEVADAFLKALELLSSRMTATEVLDLLAAAPIRARFGIEAESLIQLRGWVAGSGIRWGVDAEHRRAELLPAIEQNTWRFGLERMLLGYAMPEREGRLLSGRLPYAGPEGGSAEQLGSLAEFCETLFEARERVREPRTLPAWRDALAELLKSLVQSTEKDASQHKKIRDALADLAQRAGAAGFDRAVDLETMRAQLLECLQSSAPGRGFLTGEVTFCELEPMRIIPHRIICLLGMSEEAFNTPQPPGFDLVAQRPRRGDRSARDELRLFLLEALLSARERIVITYVGQSIRDNAELPASALVDELLDAISESFSVGSGAGDAVSDRLNVMARIRERLVVRHPLQPFSPRYFGADRDRRLFSYARNYLAGARALVGESGEPPRFLDGNRVATEASGAITGGFPQDGAPAAGSSGAVEVIDLEDLIRFFAHPIKWFMQTRLGLDLRERDDQLENREPALLGNLEQWELGDELLQGELRGDPRDLAVAAATASGKLPPGTLGACVYHGLRPEIEALAEAAIAWRGARRLAPLRIERELGGALLQGAIHELWQNGLLQAGYTRVKIKNELTLWIRHLALNWVAPQGHPRNSALIGRPEKGSGTTITCFRPVENPGPLLERLIGFYRLGHSAPLVFLPEASHSFAKAVTGDRRDDDRVAGAWSAAQDAFDAAVSPQQGPEDAYLKHAFGKKEPFLLARGLAERQGQPFDKVAREVFEPLLEHMERAR